MIKAKEITKLGLFLIGGVAIVLLSNYFIFISFVEFFGFKNQLSSLLFIFLISLSFSYIVSSVVAHFFENIFTRIFYIISSFWLGLAFYLIIFSIIAWLVIFIEFTFNFSFITDLNLAKICYAAALLFSIYNVINSLRFSVKNIVIKIKNLPPFWKNKTIIQLSDLHLGHINRGQFLAKIVSKVNEIKHELVLITGDLFDGMDGDLETFVKPLNDLKSTLGIFFITGNHEKYLGLKRALHVLRETKIKSLDDQALIVENLQLAGIAYEEEYPSLRRFFSPSKKVIDNVVNFKKGLPTILLKHVPEKMDQFKKAGINLVLCGHTHVGQMWPLGIITKMVYGKYHFGLVNDGDFNVYTSSGAGTWGPPMRSGSKSEIVAITLQ